MIQYFFLNLLASHRKESSNLACRVTPGQSCWRPVGEKASGGRSGSNLIIQHPSAYLYFLFLLWSDVPTLSPGGLLQSVETQF